MTKDTGSKGILEERDENYRFNMFSVFLCCYYGMHYSFSGSCVCTSAGQRAIDYYAKGERNRMSKLSDLLEPIKAEHVEKAIEKFDGMGQKRFLKEHGFRKAKTCWLMYEGNKYDSKAIIGVAHSFIDDKSGPLTPCNNPPYGGDPTLKKLSELGFECRKEKDGKKVSFK